MSAYVEKLRDPRWQKKRLEILSRDNWKCSFCGDIDNTLHVHHESYNGDNPWDAPSDALKTCCDNCHEMVEWFKKEIPGGSIIRVEKLKSLHRKGEFAFFILYEDLRGKFLLPLAFVNRQWCYFPHISEEGCSAISNILKYI